MAFRQTLTKKDWHNALKALANEKQEISLELVGLYYAGFFEEGSIYSRNLPANNSLWKFQDGYKHFSDDLDSNPLRQGWRQIYNDFSRQWKIEGVSLDQIDNTDEERIAYAKQTLTAILGKDKAKILASTHTQGVGSLFGAAFYKAILPKDYQLGNYINISNQYNYENQKLNYTGTAEYLLVKKNGMNIGYLYAPLTVRYNYLKTKNLDKSANSPKVILGMMLDHIEYVLPETKPALLGEEITIANFEEKISISTKLFNIEEILKNVAPGYFLKSFLETLKNHINQIFSFSTATIKELNDLVDSLTLIEESIPKLLECEELITQKLYSSAKVIWNEVKSKINSKLKNELFDEIKKYFDMRIENTFNSEKIIEKAKFDVNANSNYIVRNTSDSVIDLNASIYNIYIQGVEVLPSDKGINRVKALEASAVQLGLSEYVGDLKNYHSQQIVQSPANLINDALLEINQVDDGYIYKSTGDFRLDWFVTDDKCYLEVTYTNIKINKINTGFNQTTETQQIDLPGEVKAQFQLVKGQGYQPIHLTFSNETLTQLVSNDGFKISDISDKTTKNQEMAHLKNDLIDFKIALNKHSNNQAAHLEGCKFVEQITQLSADCSTKDLLKLRQQVSDFTLHLNKPSLYSSNKCSQHAKQAMKRNGWKIFAGVMLCLLGAVAIVAGIAATVASGGLAIVGVSLVVGTVTAATCGTTATVAGLATIGLGVSAVTSGLSLFAKQETKTSKTLRNLEAHAQESAKAAAVNP